MHVLMKMLSMDLKTAFPDDLQYFNRKLRLKWEKEKIKI